MQRSDISADIRLFLKKNDTQGHASGLGCGVIELCEKVEQCGSLNKAAREMGMAYSKAWRIVKNTEETLGVSLFVRQGAHGSSLTTEARALIDIFRRVERELTALSGKVLDDAFGEYAKKGLFVPHDTIVIETEASPELIAQVKTIERELPRITTE